MALIPKLFAGKRFAANDVIFRLLDDLVDEQERLAVRDRRFNRFEGHRTKYFISDDTLRGGTMLRCQPGSVLLPIPSTGYPPHSPRSHRNSSPPATRT